MHQGGKIEVVGRVPVKTRDDLSHVYSPGVARVALAIRDDPSLAFQLTMKRSTVAVVTDGSAVLGLGDVGPAAALPVMEGKALLFREFAGLSAFPLCLDVRDPQAIVDTVCHLAPVFGGINLEDIAAPRCFTVEEELKRRLDIPVMHDDQHGTAVAVLAALINATKVVGKRLPDLSVVVAGVGAAGVACTRMLLAAGVRDIVGCDRGGAVYRGRVEDMNPVKEWYAAHTNPEGKRGSLREVLAGADVFLGLSTGGLLRARDLAVMAKDPIVFAMANPLPEVRPEEAAAVRVFATGRSDYPNQINNVLAFPGIFRGALDCHAREINEEMKLAAALAIAGEVGEDELHEEYIVPSVFNRRVAGAVARAVEEAARHTGVARKVEP
ncbi:MAG: NADP-dependent malic enzyme [Thermaerobacter sp.]|nr:NADP-dependent malic enzyme [Thermaerobacter sp.]